MYRAAERGGHMADKPQAAAMPQASEAHKKLHVLVGDWEGEEQLSPSPWGPGGPAFGRNVIRSAADGFFIVQDYVKEKDGQVGATHTVSTAPTRRAIGSRSKIRSTAARTGSS
jgi:hypothetical protein